jgi:hypothetical protein
MLPSQSERLPSQCPLKVHEVPHTVSTGARNIDEANAPQEPCEIPLTYHRKRTGDTLPPSNVKVILHYSFCVCLKARIISSALSASDAIDGRKERHPLDKCLQNFFNHESEATFERKLCGLI